MSKVLWEGIPNEGPKAREGAKKAMSLAFVLLPTPADSADSAGRLWCRGTGLQALQA